MKEKHAPSRFRWSYLVLMAAVFMSCALIGWFGTINPYSYTIFHREWQISWNSTQEKLFLAIESGHGFYGLESDGHITCEQNRNNEVQSSGQSLTEEQRASLKNHYDGIYYEYSVVDDDVIILTTHYPVEFIGMSLSSSSVILLRNFNYNTALTVDARTFYRAVLECDNSQFRFIFYVGLFIACAMISVIGIRRLRYKYLWLCVFVVLLLISFIVGCWLSAVRNPFLVGEGLSGFKVR